MLWTVTVDSTLLDAFEDAGEPDQVVIDDYLRRTHKPRPAPKHTGVKRWYYLMRDNPRMRLSTIGMPLVDCAGKQVKVLVGVSEIIGEFPGNRALVGKRGLQLQCQPIAWLQGSPDQHFTSGAAMLAEISEQPLDRHEIEASQEKIKRRYEWHRQ